MPPPRSPLTLPTLTLTASTPKAKNERVDIHRGGGMLCRAGGEGTGQLTHMSREVDTHCIGICHMGVRRSPKPKQRHLPMRRSLSHAADECEE